MFEQNTLPSKAPKTYGIGYPYEANCVFIPYNENKKQKAQTGGRFSSDYDKMPDCAQFLTMTPPQIKQLKGLMKHLDSLKVKERNIDAALLMGRAIDLREIEKEDYLKGVLYTPDEPTGSPTLRRRPTFATSGNLSR